MRTRSLGLGSTEFQRTAGSNILLGGDDQYGYYGRVSSDQLITGDALASMIGLTAGTSQYSDTDWLKFNSGGKIIYSPMKPIRYNLSWDDINSANAVYGSKTVVIKGLTLKVRLWKGAENNPSNYTDSDKDAIGSEWNKLMLPIHENAPSSWAYTQYGGTTEDWGINFTDADLLTHYNHGNGAFSWCQETTSGDNTASRVLRGNYGVSFSYSATSSYSSAYNGWRPVLELVSTSQESQDIYGGNDMYGYYGKYQGIITPNELISLAGITQGTTKNDAYNNPNEDITWLKFSHNYKTLFVADRTIHHSVSWNHLDSKGVVFGKVVDIDGQKYLLRLLQGANVNPASSGGGANSNDEWDSLIVQFTPNTEDSHWDGRYVLGGDYYDLVNDNGQGAFTTVQETSSSSIDNFIRRGSSPVGHFNYTFTKTSINKSLGYRPVLEVL